MRTEGAEQRWCASLPWCLALPYIGEGEDELVEGERFFDVLRGGQRVVRDGGAVGLGLVEGLGAGDLGGYFEGVDGVGKAVGGEG